MFDRVSYKARARAELKTEWSAPLLVSLSAIAVSLFTSRVFQVQLLLTGAVQLAVAYFYLAYNESSVGNRPTFATFIDGFVHWFYGTVTFLWAFLWAVLWALLFVVPGIVKTVAYSQVFWIAAENPGISPRKALRLSIALTQGFKADLFLMALSFLGWILLSALTGGILLIWVIPYMSLSFADSYRYLKETAIRNGSVTEADFLP